MSNTSNEQCNSANELQITELQKPWIHGLSLTAQWKYCGSVEQQTVSRDTTF